MGEARWQIMYMVVMVIIYKFPCVFVCVYVCVCVCMCVLYFDPGNLLSVAKEEEMGEHMENPVFRQRKECTVPSGTAIPGRCVERTEQAPLPTPCSKNPFNI